MGKKIDEPEIKKECPSCGLGVSLDLNICEFCGWDFDEEDEWILQIEKLERDLMLEKQKFEPGTVNERIESSLHSPAVVKAEMVKAAPKPVGKTPASQPARAQSISTKPAASAKPVAQPKEPPPSRPVTPVVSRAEQAPRTQPTSAPRPEPVAKEVTPAPVKQSSPGTVQMVRTEARTPPAASTYDKSVPKQQLAATPAPVAETKPTGKVRRLRTVKGSAGSDAESSDSSRKLVRIVKKDGQ